MKGEISIIQDKDWIYLSGRGATESGDRRGLDQFNQQSLKKETLFQCVTASYERFISFVKGIGNPHTVA